MASAPFVLLDDQTVTATLSFVDDAGNPVPGTADAPPVWTSNDPDGTVTVTAAADGMSAVITATGKLTVSQPAQISVSAAIAGVALTGSASIQVNASAAASISMAFGTPAHK